MKTFNMYCDESCHLENDHKPYMLIGYTSVAYNQLEGHNERIKNIKKKHHYYGEIKWSNVSASQYDFYKELIEYFFATDIAFRAIIVKKDQVDNQRFNQDFDDLYYKMYYQLLNHNKDSRYTYNVYLDIKDTLSAHKVQRLKDILNIKMGVFRNVQNIHSKESLMMQLTDLLLGALSYNLNVTEKKVSAKRNLIERIRQHSDQTLEASSRYTENKMNLFFIELR
ncbi:DUF3800 domain-containing protein [Cecembia rubra]|uniref:Uncharacterized protein DUF3800 n=1 Tax=Cecembia rubra TaxID=1485585 RepID=A0A2P8E2Z5_9BACT|nr:DUF3800 domain-containing protein [Cecembia rubra]PSL03826.1 uncharacterized protein DUF3800 [Cecembia rubra]